MHALTTYHFRLTTYHLLLTTHYSPPGKLMQKNPRDRMPASEAVHHPWIKQQSTLHQVTLTLTLTLTLILTLTLTLTPTPTPTLTLTRCTPWGASLARCRPSTSSPAPSLPCAS